MRRIPSIGVLIILFALCLGNNQRVEAAPDLRLHFDLPSEPMDRALRDFALQANCNISFEPSLVVGLQAPPVKGEYSRSAALSILLAGTALKAVTVNGNTIQVIKSGDEAELDKRGLERRVLEEIVVTGTHIRGGSVASPVMEIGREEIDRSGYASLSELMLSLPQNFGGGINAGTIVNNGTVNSRYANNPTGASVPNLRGLGPGSTLTLIDGHRMASGLGGGGSDIASIPIDAIDRVEVVTDSASAIYGSDAVAGVVNIILKRDYQGAKTGFSYGYAPEGGGAEKRASQLFGTSWSGGNVMLAYEHMQQDAVDAKNRDFTAAAPTPNSLLPSTKSNSVTVSARQDVATAASMFLDGLVVARDADRYLWYPGILPAPAVYPATLRKFAVATGLDFNLWHGWKGTVFFNDAEDKTEQSPALLTSPVESEGMERTLGTLRGVEMSANGSIEGLPTGPARVALGGGYRWEGFSDAIGGPGDSSLTGVATGDRKVRYAFGELSLPLVGKSQRTGLDVLDLLISGRSERYFDVGSTTVPKVGLAYAPTASVKLRSTWGKAFRAPNLYDTNGVGQLILLDLDNPASSTGSSPVLIRSGGNPALRPETANAWSLGADYAGLQDNTLKLSATAFGIKYKNRISEIGNLYAAFTDPLNAFYLAPSPSARYAQSVVNQYPPGEVFNYTGSPFVPGDVAAVLDARLLNVSSQTARGADLNVNYRIDSDSSSTLIFMNGTYLDLSQRDTPQASSQTLSGLAFYPPKFRGRAGMTWNPASWAFTGTVNYLARETNAQVAPQANVDSWTTVDASVRFSPAMKGIWGGLNFSVSALNVLNKSPPYLSSTVQGLNYDSSNVSTLGRFITLQASKEW